MKTFELFPKQEHATDREFDKETQTTQPRTARKKLDTYFLFVDE